MLMITSSSMWPSSCHVFARPLGTQGHYLGTPGPGTKGELLGTQGPKQSYWGILEPGIGEPGQSYLGTRGRGPGQVSKGVHSCATRASCGARAHSRGARVHSFIPTFFPCRPHLWWRAWRPWHAARAGVRAARDSLMKRLI